LKPFEPTGAKGASDIPTFVLKSSNASRIREIFSLAEFLVGSTKSAILLSREVRFERR
jgi:hypothetical protein